MDFIVELFRNLVEHKDWSMSQLYNDSYSKTLKKWHGWLASSSFTVINNLSSMTYGVMFKSKMNFLLLSFLYIFLSK